MTTPLNRATFITGIGCVAAAPAHALAKSPLDRYMAPHVQMAEFSGIVAIAPAGRVSIMRSFGGSFNSRSRFRVASIAKTFTAATIDGLAASGSLRFDDKLGKYLSAFSSSEITIEQLLDHSSGVPDIYTLSAFANGHRSPISRTDYIQLLANAKPQFAPGHGNAYSNSGYSLLAFVVEQVANEPFSAAQRRLVLDRVGLSNTGVLPGTNVVPGFDPGAPDAVRTAEPIDPSWLIGNGSLYSTADDMLRWLGEVRSGRRIRTRHWPYPWGWGQKNKGKVLDGDGRYAGFACDTLIDLNSGDAVVVLSAIQSAVVNAIAGDLFASIHGAAIQPVSIREFVTLSSTEAAAYSGTYRLSADFAVSVKAFGAQPQIASADGVFETLDPMGNDRFYFRVLDTAVVFKRNTNREITAIDWGPGAFTLTRE
jgi:CubicO group peptidase (beta-lactamase class C family)